MKKYNVMINEFLEIENKNLDAINFIKEFRGIAYVNEAEGVGNENLIRAKIENPDLFVQAKIKDDLAVLLELRNGGLNYACQSVREWADDAFGVETDSELISLFDKKKSYDNVRMDFLKKMGAPEEMIIPAEKLVRESKGNEEQYNIVVAETGLMFSDNGKKLITNNSFINLEEKLKNNNSKRVQR